MGQVTTYNRDTIKPGQVWRDREGITYTVTAVGTAGALVQAALGTEYPFAFDAFAWMTLVDGAQ